VVHKVYTGSVDEVGGDVMMVGSLELGLKSGMMLEVEFVARMVVDDALAAEPRVVLWQAWAVWINYFLVWMQLCVVDGLEKVD
jgi:hypothetical protein